MYSRLSIDNKSPILTIKRCHVPISKLIVIALRFSLIQEIYVFIKDLMKLRRLLYFFEAQGLSKNE